MSPRSPNNQRAGEKHARLRAGFDIAWFLWKEVLQSPVDSSPRDGFFAKPWKHFDMPASL